MDKITVCILNYKRPQNLIHDILPRLESNPNISLIVIAHGNPAAVFGLSNPLLQNNYVLKDKILHVGNYEQNANTCCWRRWALIKLLVDREIITTKYIFSQDDDILLADGEIENLLKAHTENKGILIGGTSGYNSKNGTTQPVSGPCEIVSGRAIFGATKTIYNAVIEAERRRIPIEILKNDDICISFLTEQISGANSLVPSHFSLPTKYVDLEDDYALSKLGNYSIHRDAAVLYFTQKYTNLLAPAEAPQNTIQEIILNPKRNLLFFTTKCDLDFITKWAGPNQTYDMYVVYNGSDEIVYQKYKRTVKWVTQHMGTKFQNLHYFYQNHKTTINAYERVFILDPDVSISATDIETLYELSYRYNLSICAPSFNKNNVAAHPISIHRPGVLLQYTNFVDINTALFSTAALRNLMTYYDGSQIDCGINYMAIWSNKPSGNDAYAIIHAVQVTYPSTESKQLQIGTRFALPYISPLWLQWTAYAKRIGCPEMWHHYILGTVDLEATVSNPFFE
jgi:hypothetical protein